MRISSGGGRNSAGMNVPTGICGNLEPSPNQIGIKNDSDTDSDTDPEGSWGHHSEPLPRGLSHVFIGIGVGIGIGLGNFTRNVQ